jgi:hypothetical protein
MDPIAIKAFLLTSAVLFGGIVGFAMIDYIVRRLGGCLPGRISCK